MSDIKPSRVQVWQRQIVIYRDRVSGGIVALDDACPHRLAPLSEGRLIQRPAENGNMETVLECGYHGWRFGCNGKCIDRPSVREGNTPKTANVGAYDTFQGPGGLVFVWMGKGKADTSKVPIPKLLMESDDSQALSSGIMRRLPISFATVFENVVDPLHVQWAHHGTNQFNRSKVTRTGGGTLEESRMKDGYSRVRFTKSDTDTTSTVAQIQMPCSWVSTIAIGDSRFSLNVWVTPIDWNECALFSVLCAKNAPRIFRVVNALTPTWIQHMNTNLILDGDSVLLYDQERHIRALEKNNGYVMHKNKKYVFANGTWDIHVIWLNQFLESYSDDFPFLRPRPEQSRLLSREEINDRYEYHTKYCTFCASALRNINIAIISAAIVALVTGAAGFCCAALIMTASILVPRPAIRVCAGAFIVCVTSLLALAVLMRCRQSLTYTNRAYELSHAD